LSFAKWSKSGSKEGSWPDNITISIGDEFCLNISCCSDELGMFGTFHESDDNDLLISMNAIQICNYSFALNELSQTDRDNDDLPRRVCMNRVDGPFETGIERANRWHDYCDMARSVMWSADERNICFTVGENIVRVEVD